jgi:hypothetical protein
MGAVVATPDWLEMWNAERGSAEDETGESVEGFAEVSSLEVRWILSGPFDIAMTRMFERIPVTHEARVDAYLVEPRLDGLSVKIRGDEVLEVKAQVERVGEIVLACFARGRLDCWQKWSFPLGAESDRATTSAMWERVRKVRTMAWYQDDRWLTSRPPQTSPDPTCAVELTDITVRDEQWWTLGFEASGPPDGRRGAIRAAAAALFGEPSPYGPVLEIADAGSYSEWLRRRSSV